MGKIYETVFKNSKLLPNKIAVTDSADFSLTYKQLIEYVDARCSEFALSGFLPGTRVGIYLEEGVEVPVTTLALNKLGAIIIPINISLKEQQLDVLLEAASINLIIVSEQTKKMIANQNEKIYILKKNFLFGEKKDILSNFSYKSNAPFLITLSSGSTGKPKPIIFTEENKLNRAAQAIEIYGVKSSDIILCASPFFHSLGQRLTFLPLLVGASLVLLPKFTAKRWIEAVKKNQVSFTIPVSSHLHELQKFLIDEFAYLSSLRCIVSSSAAISKHVKKELFLKLNCDFHEMYGASEVGTVSNLSRSQIKNHGDSVGGVCPEVMVEIRSESGDVLPNKTIGEIVVSSKLQSPGYDNLPEENASSFKGGWFHTGDLGYLDGDFLYFSGRKKDIVISGGMNIYPADIESVINELTGVSVAVVIGLNDAYLGEVPVAVVVTPEDQVKIEIELRKKVRTHLSSYQHPKMYFFRDAMPMTASGKIDKNILRFEYSKLGLNVSSKLRMLQGGK
jgi:acyl-CoA synthetase (AMP-forming)/AMP-acid ligase II